MPTNKKPSLRGKSIINFLDIAFLSFLLYLTVHKIQIFNNTVTVNAVLLGDCSQNGIVDVFDLQLLSNSFNRSVGQTGYDSKCNFNGDTIVDLFDFQILSNNYGQTVTATPTPTPNIVSCLNSPGPLITLSGTKSSYDNTSLADLTKIDASGASFVNGGQSPVSFGGGQKNCWFGGKLFGGYPLNASWNTTHPTAGISISDHTPGAIVEYLYVDQIGDGIKVRQGENTGQSGIAEPFVIRDVWLRDIRDDCIESDWQDGALIDNSLLDGCYTVFATEKRSGAGTDGSNNIWEIRNTLAFMHDQIGVYSGTSPGHSMFFKWDTTSPKIKIYNSIFRVDSDVTETSYAKQFNIPSSKLLDCSNNIMVWLGTGSFPGTLPSCFTVVKDKSVWDNAVVQWKSGHGYTP